MITKTTSHNFRRCVSTSKTAQEIVFEARLNLTLELIDEMSTLGEKLEHLFSAHKQLIFSNAIRIDGYAQLLGYTSTVTASSLDVCKATDKFVQNLKSLDPVLRYLYAQNSEQKEALSGIKDVVNNLHSEKLPTKYFKVPMECNTKFIQIKCHLAYEINKTICEIFHNAYSFILAFVQIVEKANGDHNLYDQLLEQANEIHAQSLKMHNEAEELIKGIDSTVSKLFSDVKDERREIKKISGLDNSNGRVA